MIGSTPLATAILYAVVVVGFATESQRKKKHTNRIGQLLSAWGEKLSPAEETSKNRFFWLRRPVSNHLVNWAHYTDLCVGSVYIFLILPIQEVVAKVEGVFHFPTMNKETEKKLQEMKQNLYESQNLNNLCQSTLEKFKEVIDEFHLANGIRSEVYAAISAELKFRPLPPVLSSQGLQAFLSSFQTLTRELGDLAGEQPETLKVYVELAVQLDQEKQESEEALAKVQKLRQELSITTMEGLERKKNLEQKVNTLTSLVMAAIPDRAVKLPKTIQSGRYPFAPILSGLFIFTTNKA